MSLNSWRPGTLAMGKLLKWREGKQNVVIGPGIVFSYFFFSFLSYLVFRLEIFFSLIPPPFSCFCSCFSRFPEFIDLERKNWGRISKMHNVGTEEVDFFWMGYFLFIYFYFLELVEWRRRFTRMEISLKNCSEYFDIQGREILVLEIWITAGIFIHLLLFIIILKSMC